MQTIHEVEESLRQTIPTVLPVTAASGFEAQVRLEHENGRKIPSHASAERFHPSEGDRIVIKFQPSTANRGATVVVAPAPPAPAAPAVTEPSLPDPSARVVRALDQALADPRYSFVALKWFRDTELLRAGFTPEQARFELSRAIREGWVRVVKLANPNSNFPTSTLQLDRGQAFVRQALAGAAPPSAGSATANAFRPVRLPTGVSASRMIIEDRR